MLTAALIAGLVCVAAWLYLLLAHGSFWRVSRALPPRSKPITAPGMVAVIIPARNEADVIGRAITSLLRQSWSRLHIFVVDDNSSDGTAEAARAAAASQPQRVTVISGRSLPRGWTGKLWALRQGVEQALPLNPDHLLFTDADIEHAPDDVATLVGIAEAQSYDIASLIVRLQCRRLAEKLLVPAFVFFFFMLYPPEWICDPSRSSAGAAGGCLLVRPAALERMGGVAAIRQEIIDDCALARAVKRSGGKVWLGAATDTYSMRPYSFGEIERMIARNAFSQLGHSAGLLLATVSGMVLLYVLPLGLLLSGSARLAIVGAVSYLLMIAGHLPMVRHYRVNPMWALSLPLAAVIHTAATVHSAVRYWSGHGGEWKGRMQDVAAWEE